MVRWRGCWSTLVFSFLIVSTVQEISDQGRSDGDITMLEGNPVVVTEARNGKFMVFPKDLISRVLVSTGEWEQRFLELMLSTIHEGDVVLDVGANLGVMTVPLAKKVGAHGAVHSFEPQSLMFKLLNHNVALNSLTNVHTHQLCVSSQEGGVLEIPIFNQDFLEQINLFGLPGGFNYGAANLLDPDSVYLSVLKKIPSFPSEEVGITTLDSFNFQGVTMIKIDVEGHERKVLLGARRLLEEQKPVVFAEYKGNDTEELLATWHLFEELGYTCVETSLPYYTDDHIEDSLLFLASQVEDNVVCVHPDSVRAQEATRVVRTVHERIGHAAPEEEEKFQRKRTSSASKQPPKEKKNQNSSSKKNRRTETDTKTETETTGDKEDRRKRIRQRLATKHEL